jgi:putative YphP/YqiW family bacilliredoxin
VKSVAKTPSNHLSKINNLQSKIVNLISKIMYPEEMVLPMRAELSEVGFQELYTAEDVENAIKSEGTTLVVVNSVCGCAARNARPGARMSLEGAKKPDHLVTVFAGVDKEAVDAARQHMFPFPPSSPSMALFKNGELVHMLERHHIEGRPAEMIAENLKGAYAEFC